MYRIALINAKGSYLERYREALNLLTPFKMFIEIRINGHAFAVGGDSYQAIAEGVKELVRKGITIDEDMLDRDLPAVKEFLKFKYRRRGWLFVRTVTTE